MLLMFTEQNTEIT